ncbi:MAG TPA: leucine-rich repeat domain-containing protein [Candidatus Nitrosotenuis sp.]|jgi:hypothetical protein|nr:leucine-rich repeat domain-containing protein [Candidatus Nitrosotenuis sp.]
MKIWKKLTFLLTLTSSYVFAHDIHEDAQKEWIQQGFIKSLTDGIARKIPSELPLEETDVLPDTLRCQIVKDIKCYGLYLKILSILKTTKPTTDSLELDDIPVKTLPSKIATFTQLSKLSLKKDSLEEFPKVLKELRQLKELNLSQNQISIIPGIINHFKALELLNLEENAIIELPSELYELENLRKLNLGYNNISTISPDIGKLKNLRVLNLAGNNLYSIPEEILDLPHLTELHLEGNVHLFIPPKLKAELIKKVRFCYLPEEKLPH